MKNLLAGIRKIWKIDLVIYTDKLDDSSRQLFRLAYEETRSTGQAQLEPLHLLRAIAKSEPALLQVLAERLTLDANLLQRELLSPLPQGDRAGVGIKVSEQTRTVLSNALKHAREHGRSLIGSRDMLAAMLRTPGGDVVPLLKTLGIEARVIDSPGNKKDE